MADTLRNLNEALDRLPDNSTRIIDPTRVREAFESFVTDRGAAEAAASAVPVTIPITTQNAWVDIPSQIVASAGPGGMVSGSVLFWRMNANGQLAYNYPADRPGIVVPATYQRSVLLLAALTVDPASTEKYQFAFTVAGTPISPLYSVDAGSSQEEITLSLIASSILTVANADLISVAVRNTQGTADVSLLAFEYAARGGIVA